MREQFVEPVDQRRYSDYLTRVEVPMDLKFIERRLDANYYSSRYSLVFDVRLVMVNCIKYNGDFGELQDSARKMVDLFEKEMLSDEERQFCNDLKTTVTTLTAEGATESRSSLENLPPPNPSSGNEGMSRSLRIRIDVPERSRTRATRAHPDAEEAQIQISSPRNSQTRRSSRGRPIMNEVIADTTGRTRRGSSDGALPRQSPRRETRASLDSQSTLEALPDRRSTRRSTRRSDIAARMEDPEEEAASEDHDPDSDESDAEPSAEESSEEESEEEAPPAKSPARSRRASVRSRLQNKPQTRKRKVRGVPPSPESDLEGFEENDVEESPARKPSTRTRTTRNAPSQRKSSRRASAGKPPVSYADGSESEFDDPSSEEEDEDDEEPVTPPPKRSSRKRTSRRRRKGTFMHTSCWPVLGIQQCSLLSSFFLPNFISDILSFS